MLASKVVRGNCGAVTVVAVGLESSNDAAPTGTVGPRTVYQDDVRSFAHVVV